MGLPSLGCLQLHRHVNTTVQPSASHGLAASDTSMLTISIHIVQTISHKIDQWAS